jgi:hypothetical protein
MVARGAARGRSFTRASIGERWLALIAEIASAPSTRRSLVRHVAAIARQKMVAKRFRREHARGRAQARHGGERATAVPDIRARGE